MPITGYISPMQKIINDMQAKKAAEAKTTTTPPYTTPTSTTSPVTEALSKASGVSVSTIEKHEIGPVTPVVKEPAQVFTIPETKATIEIKTTPFLTPTERLLIETGFAKAPASILPGTSTERRLVYERTQEVTGPYTPTGARQVAIQQLERENILAEGYGGITTIRKTPTITSTGYDKYGYQPESYTYSTILGGMQTSEDILKSNIEASKQAGASLSTTQKYLTEGRASLENIRSAPETATIYITELDESGKEKEVGYTKSEAVKKYETYLSDLETNYQSNKELAGRKIEFENELKRLGAEETTLQAYEQAGYKATLNEKGELILSTPKASEVVTEIYGNRPDLYTAQSMRSLGLQSYASAFQYGATKLIYGKESAEKVRQAEYERLSEGILGSTKQVGESNLEFTGRFWSSPETIMDVYVPVITFGAGAALSIGGKALAGTRIGTGIIQGASKSSTLVTVGRALSSAAGQVAVVGGIVAVQEAPVIYETAMEHPEMLGSTIGRATYDVGMNLTSFTVGAEYGSQAYDILAPQMRQGLNKATMLVKENLPGAYTTGERIQYKIGEFKAKSITANEELYGRVSGVVETARVPTVTVSSRGIKYDLKSPGELKNVMTYEGERLPTVKEEPMPIKTFSQEAGGRRITYDVKTGGYTIEQVHPVASTRPFTKEATEFKPPENKPRTAYDIKTEQEPLNINLQEKYNLQGKSIQQKIEYYGKGKTYLVAKEEDYFLKPGNVTTTELETARVQSLKGTKPIRYGETKVVERQPSPDLLEKFKTTKEDIARYDLQTEQAGKKLVEWKPKQTGGLKQYELQGDTIVRVGKEKQVTDAFTGKLKREIPTRQFKILEANEDLFAYGTAKPTPQAKPFDVEFKPPENKPMSIEDVYSKIGETSKKEFVSRGTPKLKQETLEIVPKKSEFIKEGTVAGINKGIKPGSTPLKFTKPEEFKISEKTLKPSGGTITIQETAPSKFREGSLYKGIESVNRPLTSEEITILRSAEEATYPERYNIPKIVRVGGSMTLGSTEKIIHGELSTQKPMQIRMKDIGLGLRTRVGEQQVVGEIGKMRIGQVQEGKYGSEQAQKLSSRLAFDVKQDMGISTKQEQVQQQRQVQRQVQFQEQTTELKTRFITPREVTIKKRIKIPPPYIPKEEEVGRRRIGMVGKKKLKFTSKPSKQDKGLLADLLSVTQSQARYGTATHPKLTTVTWAEAKQSGYMKVPTEELKRGGIRKNMFGNKRGNKNVFK